MIDQRLFIQAAVPPGPSVPFGLLGDASLTRGQAGTGGWQIVDRPRRIATIEWLDYSPFQLTLSLVLEGNGVSVEPLIAVVEGWELPAPGGIQPAVLDIAGPVPHAGDLQWVVSQSTWKQAIRDPDTGQRTQQYVDLILWQYAPVTSIALSPAQTAAQTLSTSPTSSGTGQVSATWTYKVKAGDTLERIAAAQLGSASRWTQISALNGIRDGTQKAITQQQAQQAIGSVLVPAALLVIGQTLGMPPR